ncbi:MAG TPA: response regulator [Steroidobacteraceae bacterium]|nr:response regulator [Steroidobacteraceae bacterium]
MSDTPVPLSLHRSNRFGPALPRGTFAGFAAAIVTVLLIAYFGYRSLDNEDQTAALTEHTLQVIQRTDQVLSSLKDAETGQRGFLLTGRESYLEPYNTARASIPGQLAELRRLVAANPQQRALMGQMERFAAEKLTELQQTIDLKRAGNPDGALTVVLSDRGKISMDHIREVASQLLEQDHATLAARSEAAHEASRLTLVITAGGAALLFVLILAAGALASRDFLIQQTEAWLQTGQNGLSERMQGEQRLDVLGQNVLEYLARYLEAQVGTLYIVEPDGSFYRVAGYALSPGHGAKADALRPGDGLAGQAAKENRVLVVNDAPADYLAVMSSLGTGRPAHLLIAPASEGGSVQAVVELGFFRPVQDSDRALLRRVRDSIGIAVRSSKDRTRLEELLEETQRQAEELQTQQEELRVANEELSEQGQALKESQARLESQQTELEQTNSQLEQQASILEQQRDELQRAQLGLAERAAELARSNRYKSEFLANMSHELRTPLNSSLILAKLLADNKHGNLNEEQVKFAQTIFGAGNDLLALINDILDLSKIEAGKVEVQPESVDIERSVEALLHSFEPQARERGLGFTATLDPGVPERILTDPQRLGQILKNLLSNAFKFTEQGSVSLRVSATDAGEVVFAVQDSGIGIPAEQHHIIFEAFRQADGSTHRKYGGTGLGLSISRDLARLLGGDVTVQSEPAKGSVFTLKLPQHYVGPVAAASRPSSEAAVVGLLQPEPQLADVVASVPSYNLPASPSAGTTLRSPEIADDRASLTGDSRVILIVEDDVRFAAILRDLARELGFACIATHTAADGLAAAQRFRAHAIILDMNLPDRPGLEVLNVLKRNPITRHIPVHVVSVADFSQEALSLGAVGYALKPVTRGQLMAAFQKLETKLQQGVRRVLVVEDDERQRESIYQLLCADGVEISGAATATEALERLSQTTFDCLVLDLNLPDLSGYEMLERMAERDEVSFPPVIVYTGRSLARDEEQRLRRFSRSIIVKDVRSPERLLDEVTLFLHQVEAKLPVERQRMLREARDREAAFEGRRILIVEDDVRNIFALSKVLEPRGAKVEIARNGREALEVLERCSVAAGTSVALVLMDIMMPEMDGLTAMREIRKRPQWQKLPIIALTAKAMKDDQEKCLQAGANDYIAKPLDVDKLLSLIRVWMAQ